GDVVARALAQLAGGVLTPITFSFGWVACSVSALVSAVGENKLMPQDPDCKCIVINGKSTILRDFDEWSDQRTKKKIKEILDEKWKKLKAKRLDAEMPTRAGLVVTIYEPSVTKPSGIGERDVIYWSGLLVLVVQLGVAAIPCGLFGDWGILLITVSGNALAIATGLLPQWKKEKGNGAQHAIVILGNKHGLNLEDLASGQSNLDASANQTIRALLLKNTWFLLALGAIGIVQNIFVAGWNRRPESFGIPLDFVKVLGKPEVMDTLFEIEEKYGGLGRSMLSVFFPGKLRRDDIKKWAKFESEEAQSNAYQARMENSSGGSAPGPSPSGYNN
ncbi:hypothetical protein N7520_005204, partial [Penicillium odoratum]|uniref:uncharacterized protein n=1 Tax=Penicillium odoratum TaxID=1167516 RepID=UPI0025486D35